MNDLEERVKVLENKVKILEETLETLKNMNLSEQMEGYIKKRSQTLKMVDLLNAVSDQPALDFSQEEAKVSAIQSQKADLDKKIAKALVDESDFYDQYPDDPEYFEYEIENGTIGNTIHRNDSSIQELAQYVGKGIRITGYNGFDTKRVIIPSKIDGLPVVSIGRNAFSNVTTSEIIMPQTIKAILSRAFMDCYNLKHIFLPKELLYIGRDCFFGTKIKIFIIPQTVKKIYNNSFKNRNDYTKRTLVFLGKEIDSLSSDHVPLQDVSLIYCLPGSKVVKYARNHGIPIKPLNEFNMADYLLSSP